jgi:HTH-type transcriptional repressor of NAD biosynthesis genes
MLKNTLVLGKFLPPHRGHELLIDTAIDLGYPVTVVVGGRESDLWPVGLRTQWIRKHWKNAINTIAVNDDNEPFTEYDEEGTALNEEFWDYWVYTLNNIERFTHVVSCDVYGKELAKRLGAIWVPVDDPDRPTTNNMSSTKVRTHLIYGGRKSITWNEIIPSAQKDIALKIAVVGPESVGKSTLCSKLPWHHVPEYGRTLSVARNHKLDAGDFNFIIRQQRRLVEQATRRNSVVISDTEAYTTYLFSKIYLDKSIYKPQPVRGEYDLYVLLSPDVPWVQDGERLAEKQREDMYEDMYEYLVGNHLPFVSINGSNFDERLATATQKIQSLIDNRNKTLEKSL